MANDIETLSLGPWEKGVNYSKATEDCEEDELAEMKNTRIGPGGYVEKRLGTASYGDEDALGSSPTLTACGEFHKPGSVAIPFIVAGTAFYEYTASASKPRWTARTGDVTITADDDNTFEWCRAHTVLILTNGINPVKKWTGATANITDITHPSGVVRARHCAYWDNRLWLGHVDGNTSDPFDFDDRVWYSANDDPDTWASTSYYNLGSSITGIEPFQNSLSIHTEEGIWALIPTGNAEHPYQLQQRIGSNPNLPSQGGTVSGRSILSLPNNEQLFVLNSGIYRWEGGDDVEKISGNLDDGYWSNLNISRLHKSFAVYFAQNNEAWFFLPYGAAQTNMNNIMIYNTEMDLWFGPYDGFERDCAAIINNKPHAGDFDGILFDHQPADTYTDGGSAAISASFRTAAPAPGDEPALRNRWLYARTYFDVTGDYNILVAQESSGIEGGASESLVPTGGGFTLNTDSLDNGTLSTIRMLSSDTDLTGYDPHSSLTFSNNNAGEFFKIRHTHLQYREIGRKRKRKVGAER